GVFVTAGERTENADPEDREPSDQFWFHSRDFLHNIRKGNHDLHLQWHSGRCSTLVNCSTHVKRLMNPYDSTYGIACGEIGHEDAHSRLPV
ncbi:hypothetical protein KJ612_14380, partial [Myxococcota bacterium]|nr:hypothetical protein [Myxococcota bacterium]